MKIQRFLKKLENFFRKSETVGEIIFWFLSIKRNMIILIGLFLIMNQTELILVHNQKDNCDYDHISFNLKGIRKLFVWMQSQGNIVPIYYLVNYYNIYYFLIINFYIWQIIIFWFNKEFVWKYWAVFFSVDFLVIESLPWSA